MNPTFQKLSLCALVCLLVAGCHSSSSTPAPVVQVAVAAPQPAPVAPVAPQKLVCTGFSKDDAQGADFIESQPTFTLMQSKLGGWTSCSNKKSNGTDEVTTITFPHGGILTIGSYPSSDASSQEAVLDAGSSLTRDDAINALKQDGPADGCGVDWKKLSSGTNGDLKASGTSCTLDVHVKVVNGSVVGFGFGVAA
jgi:hypothetical protein